MHVLAAHAHHGFSSAQVVHVLHNPIAAIAALAILVFCLPAMFGKGRTQS